MSQCTIINPLECDHWDQWLVTQKDYSFFHSQAWIRVLQGSYGYHPTFFASYPTVERADVVPCMEVNSLLTGKRGVSLPFSDFCEPIVQSQTRLQEMLKHMIQFGKRSGWKTIELRFKSKQLKETDSSQFYLGHQLDLRKGRDALLANIRESTRRNIKKATRNGVNCDIERTIRSLKSFYCLHCQTRKEHALPPQPWSFFENIYNHIISPGKGFVILATYQDRPIAGAVYLRIGEKLYYKYGASEKTFQHLRANNLLMWTAIDWCIQNGLSEFDFGRTNPENTGLLQFKRGWRGREKTMHYYTYDLRKDDFVSSSAGGMLVSRLCKHLPLPALRIVGLLLYRHVG